MRNKTNCKIAYFLTGDKWNKCFDIQRRVYDTDYLSPALTTCGGGNQEVKISEQDNLNKIIYEKPLDRIRIRKLTPKECWRLMGFSDEDFEKAEKVNSNAQLYKQAGNSIVVNVLMAIFKEMM